MNRYYGRAPQQKSYSRQSQDAYYGRTSGGSGNGGNRNGNGRKRKRRKNPARIVLAIVVLLLIAALIFGVLVLTGVIKFGKPNQPNVITEPAPSGYAYDASGELVEASPTPEPTPTPVPTPDPQAVDSTTPEAFGLQVEMELDGQPITEYNRTDLIEFPMGDDYTDVEGIVTFRGNNFRNDPTYGNAGDISGSLTLKWTKEIPESIAKSGGSSSWFGVGWTGQPLITRWDEATRQIMNINADKKAKDGLTEVIYATEGSYIYFLDLDDGTETRDKVAGKWTFKGSGALDPRGYPLMYVGAGDAGPNGPSENMIISLIDCSKLYSYGSDDPYSLRKFKAFDGSTAVHAATDSVTYASESGIIYQYKLNTQYDQSAGTISVNPSDILKWRYTTQRNRDNTDSNKYWLGFESSPIFWRNYMYVTDNGGNLFCIDVNTMKTVWMQDVLDDTNCTPVFEADTENHEYYIYIGTSTHWTCNSNWVAHIPFWKINALTGEVVWEADGYDCIRNNEGEVSGGIQDTAALGKNGLDGLVYVTYSRIVGDDGNAGGSVLVAYDTATGQEVWSDNIGGCSWSSPVCVYDSNGKGYVIQCAQSGKVYMFDGLTGEQTCEPLELEGNFEASPAVFEDMIVIGTRGQKIYGIQIS